LTVDVTTAEVRRRVRADRRGFDDGRAHLPALAVTGPIGRAVEPEEIRGSFAAIESLAGWFARTVPMDWRDGADLGVLRFAARELGVSAMALLRALEDLENGQRRELEL
jgi:hypothetical protein